MACRSLEAPRRNSRHILGAMVHRNLSPCPCAGCLYLYQGNLGYHKYPCLYAALKHTALVRKRWPATDQSSAMQHTCPSWSPNWHDLLTCYFAMATASAACRIEHCRHHVACVSCACWPAATRCVAPLCTRSAAANGETLPHLHVPQDAGVLRFDDQRLDEVAAVCNLRHQLYPCRVALVHLHAKQPSVMPGTTRTNDVLTHIPRPCRPWAALGGLPC
jgi:hypothetical protein